MSDISSGWLDDLSAALSPLDPSRYNERVTQEQDVTAHMTSLTLWTYLSHYICDPSFAHAIEILSLKPEARDLLFRVLHSLNAENDDDLLQITNIQEFGFRPREIPEHTLKIYGTLGDNQVNLSSTTQILETGVVPRVANIYVNGVEDTVLLDLPIYIFSVFPVDEELLKTTIGISGVDDRVLSQQPDGRFITIIKNHYKEKDPDSFFPETYLAGRFLTQIALLSIPSMIVEIEDEDQKVEYVEGGPLFCYIQGSEVYYPEPEVG
jgi:hypothetical protein